MANVHDAANFFIDLINSSEDDRITNLKLNKLLYYTQGCFLSRTGHPFFDEQIEAWELGPIVPSVYKKYHVCGSSPIEYVDENYSHRIFSLEEKEAMIDVMREYGCYTGSALIGLIRAKDTPWSKAFAQEKAVLANEDIKAYFDKNKIP